MDQISHSSSSRKSPPISSVTAKVQDVIKEALSELPKTLDKLVKDNLSVVLPAVNTQSKVTAEKLERKLEIRIQGIPESNETSQFKRMQSDESTISEILEHLNEWDPSNISSIKRLGPFKASNNRPRSILVKFANEWTASKCLRKAHFLKTFKSPVFLSKSLSSDELALEKRVLKKRWELISNGTPKEDLKIRNLQLLHKDTVIDITS